MQFERRALTRLDDATKVLLGKYVSAMGRSGQISQDISCSRDPSDKWPYYTSDRDLKEVFGCFVRFLLSLYSPLPISVGKNFGLPYLENISYPLHLAVAVYTGRPVMSRQRYQEVVLQAINGIKRDPYAAGSERDQLLSIYNRCMSFKRMNEKADFARYHRGSIYRGVMNREIGKSWSTPTRYTSFGAHPPLKYIYKYR